MPVRRADHEGAGAGAAGQAGGLGVEEQQVARVHRVFVALGEGQRQGRARDGLRQEGLDQVQAGREFAPGQAAIQ